MVYDRRYDDEILSFEASGALKAGSLIMRDRETDSWWSIMTSQAIGGAMDGEPLKEMAVSEKTTWGQWRAKHPDSKVLAVTHVASNAYEGYFSSDRTFRELQPEDTRLPARANIFVFELDGVPVAVEHSVFEGGRLFRPDGTDGDGVLLFRSEGAQMFESTRAYRVPAAAAGNTRADALLARLDAGGVPGVEPIAGLDTFWYNFILQNPGARILE